jgi:hypothetical protein
MKSSARFFLRAVALAVALSGIGFGYLQYEHSRTATLQSKCEAQSKKEMDAFNAQQKDKTGPWTMYQSAGLTCDPSKLYMDTPYSTTLPGVQGELLTAYREESSRTENVFYGIAFFIVFIGTLPAIWYFFLARLSEVAAAVRRS